MLRAPHSNWPGAAASGQRVKGTKASVCLSRTTTVRVLAQALPFLNEEPGSSMPLEKSLKKKAASPGNAFILPTPLTSPTERSLPRPQPQPQLFPQPGEPQWPPKRSFTAVALDNLADSVGDVVRHLRRLHVTPEDGNFQRQREQLVSGDSGRMRLRASTKPVVLVLGSGWGAHSLIKVIDTDVYDVVVVSPRNHFVFTPMLPSTAVGTVEFRSLLEPIRTSNPFVTYLEAECDSLDPNTKVATCTSSFSFTNGERPQFEIQYDKAVVAVGEQTSTFGVPGVCENCFFMKEISDAVGLRKRIAEKFELASMPATTEEQRYAALHFVVVGGGPTGVEFAGTLSDFLREDLRKKYPALMKYVKVTLLQNLRSILTQFDERMQQMALRTLESSGVEVRTNVTVVGVTKDKVLLQGGEELDHGVCLWSAGNGPRPIVRQITSQLPEQAMAAQASRVAPGSKLFVDSFLRVVGASDLMALGDCSLVLGNRLPPTAQVAGQQGSYVAHLINVGYTLGVGGYTQPPPFEVVKKNRLQDDLEGAKLLQWLATAMMGGPKRIEVANEVADALFRMDAPPWVRAHSQGYTASISLDEADPTSGECDIGLALEAAAASGGADPQVAARASTECRRAFLEQAAAVRKASEASEVRYCDRPFEFLSLGIMAYVGSDKALTQVEAFDFIDLKLHGALAFLLWRSVYITKQVSFRNRVLILFDWFKTSLFGRDISLF